MEQKDSEKGTENPPEVSSKPESSPKDVENPPEGSSKPESSDKNTPRSLKAKSKIMKISQAGKIKTKRNKAALQIRGKQRKRKNKKVVGDAESCRNGEGNADKKISEDSQQKETADEQLKEKNEQAEKNNEKESQNKSSSDKHHIKNSHQAKKNKEKIIELDKSEQKQKNKEKHREPIKGARSRANRDKRGGMENSPSSEKKKEKLGGLIFMCNAKTKPDCFRYRVMGVSAGKKDVVLGVKPGLKLFLYDFDFKLLYGIYKASSSGGMKLEPRAFGGSFPAQVRFNIVKDCFPLPESIFKKAIKENYNEKHKFKTELTVRQVRKLTELFRPVETHSSLQPVRSPPKAIIRNREDLDSVRGSWPHSHRERPARDSYTHSHVNSYNVLPHDRDHRIERREEIPRDLFLTEKDYRAYGLQGDRRNETPPSHVNPIPEPYKRGYEREHFHHLDSIYRDNVPARAESLRTDPLYLNESEHQAYAHGAIRDYTKDPYAYRYGASPRDPYLPPLSREEISSSSYLVGGRNLIGTDDLQRRETVQDRHYSIYSTADALSDYNRMQHYQGAKPEAAPLPVSSRYSFAGPSYSYR